MSGSETCCPSAISVCLVLLLRCTKSPIVETILIEFPKACDFLCIFSVWSWKFSLSIPSSSSIHTGIPCFLKICLTLLCFYERPESVSVFTNPKTPEEDFCFYKKRVKSKNSVERLCCSEQLTEAAQQQASRALTCVSICAASRFILCIH